MSNPPEYVFTRDLIDNNRINLQHYQWVELFGYHLHPQIPTTSANLRIADVATGTGVWLTNLSTRVSPAAQLDGLDISLEATPPTEWLPHNVRFMQWDIKQAVPAALLEKYDIVHIRLLSFVLQDDEIPSVLQNVIKLLKPGGYLQWEEPDVSSFRIEKTQVTNSTEALKRLLTLSQSQDSRLNPKWVPQLTGLFSGVGQLHDVQADVRDAPGHQAIAMHECNLMLHELLSRTTRSEAMSKELKNLMTDVIEETRKGACWAFTRWSVIGRKPI
ncbi:hypothetical protein GQX73_g10636 [Xylaria multiplex]|uniref:Methyltransferase domain-containing protein n=1 Tax=Xylaria multiplex TaxID=323545 RepID=A0A7C8MQF1_9PEZI|nr:hypothetical protein GQX73_g10636 [Xylaria multiplex]